MLAFGDAGSKRLQLAAFLPLGDARVVLCVRHSSQQLFLSPSQADDTSILVLIRQI